MQLGMIGLGRMGANMTRRLMRDGHDLVVYDVNAEAVAELEGEGATGSASLEDFVAKLEEPRAVWIMIPAALVDRIVDQVAPLLSPRDTIVDGGNSYYKDDLGRARRLQGQDVHYVDVGVSGGVFGLERGFCLMIGGEDEVVSSSIRSSPRLHPGSTARPVRRAGVATHRAPSRAICIAARTAPATL